MALDDHDRNYIREELRQIERHLSDKIALVDKTINAHMTDRFAHGWDHTRIQTSDKQLKEWMDWRTGVDKWRWMITGALVVTAIEAPIVATLITAYWHH